MLEAVDAFVHDPATPMKVVLVCVVYLTGYVVGFHRGKKRSKG